MGFRALRVINEDRVAGGAGFGRHPHRDMEIVSYVISGSLEHKDSMGTGSVIRPGEVQKMSAGTGVTHSEFNGSPAEEVHFLQIWLLPNEKGNPPSYEQRAFPEAERLGRWRSIVSPNGEDGSLRVLSDATIYASILGSGTSLTRELAPGKYGWIQVVRGQITVFGESLREGDAIAFAEVPDFTVAAVTEAELLLFVLD
jgi:hypothetical protein